MGVFVPASRLFAHLHSGLSPPVSSLVQPTSPNSARSHTLLKRLLVAQESGLVLVIVLLMAILTIFSGKKDQRDFLPLDAGTQATEVSGTITATIKGTRRTFASSEGWELRTTGEIQSVQRTRQINKFLNLENLMQILLFASFIAILAVGVTAVIIMGGIDLSLGSSYALAALIAAIALRYPWASEGFPAAKFKDSTSLWWTFAIAGIAALVARTILVKLTHSRNAAPSTRNSLSGNAIPNALLWAGVGILVAVAWQLIAAMHETGRQVEGGMLAKSTMGALGSLTLGLVVCLIIGAFCGWLNGKMVVGLRVHPFIITLGTMAAFRGITALPTQAQSVGNFPDSFQNVIKWDAGDGITPVPILIMIATCLAGVIVLSRTVIGRQIYAIGGNETAATYAGIHVGKVKTIVYTLMGALAGLSAYAYLGYFGGAAPNAGEGYELKAIAAAVIGGASLSGGRGSALGAVLGAILVQLIDNAMVILQIDQSYNKVVLGGAIIIAVVLDQLKSRLVPVGK